MNSPKGNIENSGKFSSISISNAQNYYEKAKNNKIQITDKSLYLSINKGSTVSKVTVKGDKSKVWVNANGIVKNVTVDKMATVNVYKGGEVKNITVKKDSNINVSKGARVNTISVTSKASVKVKGNTDKTVKIKANAKGTVIESSVKSEVIVIAGVLLVL